MPILTEVEHYLEMIEDLRGQIRDLVAGLPAEALNWRPIKGSDDHATNSLAVLAAHVAGAEHFWIAEVIGRQAPTRDRDAEFITQVASAAELVERLEKTGQETRQILPGLNLANLQETRRVRDRTVPVRWAILHVIDHSSLHLGHMQLTYQLWQGGQATRTPRWYERLPGQDKD